MAKAKTKLIVVGDASVCGSCKNEKAFLKKHGAKIKKLGIDEVEFITPSEGKKSETIATMLRKKHINGQKMMPLNVVVSGSEDTHFLGFSDKTFTKRIKDAVREVSSDDEKKSKKKRWPFGR